LLYNYALPLKKHGCNLPVGYTTLSAFTLGCNAEAYVDEVVIKTREDGGPISDLAETLDNLRKFKMMLNPEKCTFSVSSRKLLRYMVSRRSIDSNVEKVSTISKIKLPESLHDV
jgi:hypothetical protein